MCKNTIEEHLRFVRGHYLVKMWQIILLRLFVTGHTENKGQHGIDIKT